jgi:hypothetical protein
MWQPALTMILTAQGNIQEHGPNPMHYPLIQTGAPVASLPLQLCLLKVPISAT